MRLRQALLVFALAAPCGLPAGDAWAGDDKPQPTWKEKQEAASHFKAGVRAFWQHKYVEAAESFEKANEVLPNHKALFNAADAWEKAGELVKAARKFRQYLEIAPEQAKARDEAQSRLEAILTKVGRLDLAGEGASDITVDGESVALGEMLVAPGEHVVAAVAGGEPVKKVVTVDAGAILRVLLEPPPPPPPPEPEVDSGPIEKDKGVEDANTGMSPTIFYVGVAVSAALAGATVWSGLDTQSKRDDFDANPTGAGYDDGVSAQRRTNIILGLTAAAGVTTAALGLFAVKWDDGKQADVAVSPSAATVRLRF